MTIFTWVTNRDVDSMKLIKRRNVFFSENMINYSNSLLDLKYTRYGTEQRINLVLGRLV